MRQSKIPYSTKTFISANLYTAPRVCQVGIRVAWLLAGDRFATRIQIVRNNIIYTRVTFLPILEDKGLSSILSRCYSRRIWSTMVLQNQRDWLSARVAPYP